MSTVQLKSILMNQIFAIEDEDFLLAIEQIIAKSRLSETAYQMNKEQQNLIETGRKQVKEGFIIANEQLEAEEKKWLEK